MKIQLKYCQLSEVLIQMLLNNNWAKPLEIHSFYYYDAPLGNNGNRLLKRFGSSVTSSK